MNFGRFLTAMCALLSASFACAADRSTDELVVSAYRPLAKQELDTSLTLLNGDDIERASVSNFEQIVQLVPNMNLSGEANRARYFQLRGVGEREQYEGAPNPSVGFLIDDIDLSGIGGITSTFDLERVEVLRGPQSARYGSSALAGMVYVQSQVPTDDLSVRAELTGGSDEARAAGIAVGGGIVDGLSGRLSVYQYEDSGFRNNLFLGRDDTNARDELTVRGKLLWKSGSDWAVQLTGLYADYDNGYDAFAIDNRDVTWSDEPGRDEQETKAGALRISGPVNAAVQLVSITTLAESDVLFSFDSDWVFDQAYLPAIFYEYRYLNPRTRSTRSQEFRLVSEPVGRLFNGTTDWVIGVYGQTLKENNQIDSTGLYIEAPFCPGDPANPPNRPGVPFDPLVAGLPAFACITDRQIISRYEADTLALFGSIDSRLTDTMTLSAGLRVEHWDAKYSDMWQDNSVFVPVTTNNAFSPDDTLVGGHVALTIDVSSNLRSYMRIAKGFKSGGFNPSLSALSSQQLEYQAEELWNFEVGLKGEAMQGDLAFDLAFFSQDREDAQLSQSTQFDVSDPNTFVFVTNNGQARTYGLEGSANWKINDSWELFGALGLLDSKINEWDVQPIVEGRDLAHAPSYTMNAGVNWSGPLGLFARLDVNAVDAYYFDISNDQKSDDYQLVNLRIGKEWENWSVSVWGRNIFDEKYATRGFFFGNEPPAFAPTLYTKFGDPRQIGLTLQYRYD